MARHIDQERQELFERSIFGASSFSPEDQARLNALRQEAIEINTDGAYWDRYQNN